MVKKVIIGNISAAASGVTATKVDSYTITLSVAITTKDLLELAYVATTEYPVPT